MANLGDIMTLDLTLCEELDKLIENLTTSGQSQLDPEKVKRLKKICRQSDDYVKKCFHLLMIQLEKSHSEIRLSTVQVCDELFMRSHCFRDLLLSDFQYFMELTLETNGDYPLPDPVKTAKTLKSKAAESIHRWQQKFGDIYKKLSLGYHFLKNCKKINFNDIHVRTIAEQQREEERIAKTEAQQKEKLSKALQDMTESIVEVKTCITQAQNCLALLLPNLQEFDIQGLRSPEIFRKQNPWKRRKSDSSPSKPRHINKSTKFKDSSTNESVAMVTEEVRIKNEPISDQTDKRTVGNHDNNLGNHSNTQKSPHVNKAVNKFPSGQNHQIDPTFNLDKVKIEKTSNMSKDDISADKCDKTCATSLKSKLVDVKPTAADLEKALDNYKEKLLNNAVTPDPVITQENSNSRDTDDSSEFQELSSQEEEESEEAEVEDMVRSHGLGSQNYSITVDVVPSQIEVVETSDNEDILMALKDSVRLIDGKFLPSVTRWLEVFSKMGADQAHVKKALDIRDAVTKLKEKIGKLKIIKAPPKLVLPSMGNESNKKMKPGSDEEEEDEDDFEEVTTKEGFEPRIPDELREEYGLVEKPPKPRTNPDWILSQEITKDEDDPTSFMSTVKALKHKIKQEKGTNDYKLPVKDHPEPVSMDDSTAGPSTSAASGGRKKYADVPAIPYGTDLHHWGKKIEAPLMVTYESEHRFMNVKDGEAVVDLNALASMKSRVINFTGEFQPVKWSCRAPMANGTLCQRMDRVKCPFHGKVIPRDIMGNPSKPEDILRIKREAEVKQEDMPPEWEDPQLLADIKAATGIDLERKGRGQKKSKGKDKGKGRQRKFPGLTDIKKVHNTSRHRLENKVLSRQSMKRVAEAMGRIEAKRRCDKFGNTFNYVHSRTKK